MKLAREFHRADWRAFLAGMSSSELTDWHKFYQSNYFHDVLIDTHFSHLQYMTIAASLGPSSDLTPKSFSLLSQPAEEEPYSEQSAEEMMALASGIAGGTRFGGTNQ